MATKKQDFDENFFNGLFDFLSDEPCESVKKCDFCGQTATLYTEHFTYCDKCYHESKESPYYEVGISKDYFYGG